MKMNLVLIIFVLTLKTTAAYNFSKSIEFKETILVEAISQILKEHKSTSISISKNVDAENSVVTGVIQAIQSKHPIIFESRLRNDRHGCNILFADDLNGLRLLINFKKKKFTKKFILQGNLQKNETYYLQLRRKLLNRFESL